MKVEISDTTYRAIAAVDSDVSAFVERAAKRELLQAPVGGKNAPRIDSREAKRKLHAFREKLAGVSAAESVADARQGRE